MITKLLRGMLATAFFGVTSSAWSQAPTPELLHYRFDGTGTSVPNLASAPPAGTATATIQGALTQGSTGQCGGALIGTGTSSSADYVNTNWVTNLDGMSWTISFWTNNVPNTTNTHYILGDLNAGQIRVFTGGVAGGGNWILRGTFTDVLANGGAAPGPTMTTFVYDMPNNEIRSYVNGVLNQTVAQTVVSVSGPGPFKVGGYSSSANLPSGSLMDEFRLYNRALSQAEINSLMIAGSTSSFSVEVCESYTTPSGDSTYTVSGTYMDTIPNINGCDSVMTIDVNILSPSASTIAPVVCDEYDSPSGNYQWTASGTYTDTIPNAAGCDSVITIDLTVNHPTFSTFDTMVCDADYTAPDGATYTVSGTYMATIPNANGCDSVITINLAVNASTSSTIDETACGQYTAPDGTIYTSSGSYAAMIPNAAGCDSTIIINLTIEQIDTVLTYDNLTGTLTANQSTGVTYQWVHCTTGPIINETGQSFTPAANGEYAVLLTSSNCSEYSSCWNITNVGLEEFSALDLSLFPNPVSSELTIANAKGNALTLYLFDNAGKLLQTIATSETEVKINLQDKASGVYQLKVAGQNGEKTFKIVRN